MSTCKHCGADLAKFGRRDRAYCDDVCKARAFRRRRAGVAETMAGRRRGVRLAAVVRPPEPVFFAGRVATYKLLRRAIESDSLPTDLRSLAGLLALNLTWGEIADELQASPSQLSRDSARLRQIIDRKYTRRANARFQGTSRGTQAFDDSGTLGEVADLAAWAEADARGEAFASLRDSTLP